MELLWEVTVALLLSVQRHEAIFFPALSLPFYLVFFSSLRSPSTVFLFHRVLLPLLLLFFSPSARSFFWL